MRRFQPSVFICLLGVPLAAWTAPQRGAASAAGGEPSATDPLVELNKTFRKAYAATRRELLTRADPLILVEGDELVLLHRGKRVTATVVPEKYHTLKAVAHIPLAIYVMLLPTREGALSDGLAADLSAYLKQLATVEKSLEGRGFARETQERLTEVLGRCHKFLDPVIETKQLKPGALGEFARGAGPVLLEVSAEAGRAEIDSLHRQVSAWRATMTGEEWRRLRVVILGSQMPRKGNLATQYFAKLLREPGEGQRIIYAEGLGDENRALNLLGTHLVDTQIGADFFLDPRRMHRDLLSDAATEYLQRINFEESGR